MNTSLLCLFVLIISIVSAVLSVSAKPLSKLHNNKKFASSTSSLQSHEQRKPRTPQTLTQTPPMGWNSWNLYGCLVSADLLMQTSDALVKSGLAKLGYVFINSDDCWMTTYRNTTTNTQVPNPITFPQGWQPVTDHIHSRCINNNPDCGGNQLFAGLYTAKGPHTCQHKMASCNHEAIDAKYYASIGIDYVKDDSCSTCPGSDDDQDYRRMWLGIQQSKRPMFLSVEADPVDTIITRGGYANSKRVGHDIKSYIHNVYSLVDIGANLYPFSHNGKSNISTTGQGFWNDLDMLEIGNGPDFLCSESDFAAARCRMHFSYWTIMKSLLLLGNDVMKMDSVTLSTVSNERAIAINQDPLGVQARRVQVHIPKNNSLSAYDYTRNYGVIRICNSTKYTTQKWKFIPASTGTFKNIGYLQTKTPEGQKVCLTRIPPHNQFYGVAPCPTKPFSLAAIEFLFEILDIATGKPCSSVKQNCTFGVGFNNQKYASGPWPSSRYLDGSSTTTPFHVEVDKVMSDENSSEGGYIMAADTTTIQNDNLEGTVTLGGEFCLDATTMGTFEVWAGALANKSIAVLFSNRGPANQSHCVGPETIGAQISNYDWHYLVTNVWTGEKQAIYFWDEMPVLCANVPPLDVVYYTLTLVHRSDEMKK